MELDKLIKKIAKLEYHQSLLLQMLDESEKDFYKLVIKHSLSEKDVNEFFKLCDRLTLELEKQREEGFVNFHPLYDEFIKSIDLRLNGNEVIRACLRQKLYISLMEELKKYI